MDPLDPYRAPYHHGSLAVQDRVGVRDQAAHVGRSIGQGIKPVAAAFLGLQPMLVLAAADGDGRMWASLLTGEPGFVRATGPHSASVAGGVHQGDPLAGVLGAGETPVGAIALDPRTRRRMRMGGTVRPSARGLAIEAERVFANCPKYLQKRELYTADPGSDGDTTGAGRRSGQLTPGQQEFIRAADTFFIATGTADGVDASHRGGNPGFVQVTSPTTLGWQDYPGNAMFLTLGNLETDPRAGLLFLDWSTGTTLQLTGTAHTEYSGTGRTVRFAVEKVVETEAASPLRWSAPEYSPANPPLE
ncbi:pyridoxamine 5'-phosphate oxidase family protein [Streptomyces sp. NPDC005408]|uniref:pyridoxamine 5'-phosphate oxidase family protein n=1 Tax=Streptomyces sp. NPDC005408 TaxID=3155341 RepID=UPI0033AD6227